MLPGVKFGGWLHGSMSGTACEQGNSHAGSTVETGISTRFVEMVKFRRHLVGEAIGQQLSDNVLTFALLRLIVRSNAARSFATLCCLGGVPNSRQSNVHDTDTARTLMSSVAVLPRPDWAEESRIEFPFRNRSAHFHLTCTRIESSCRSRGDSFGGTLRLVCAR